jgi:hypothetical protein
MVPLVRRVMQQTRARVFRGDAHFEGKIISVFEPSAEVIRKGKVGTATARNGAPDTRDASGVVKRRHGLDRCRYKTEVGMQRWVGLGVISDNLLNIGRAMSQRAAP